MSFNQIMVNNKRMEGGAFGVRTKPVNKPPKVDLSQNVLLARQNVGVQNMRMKAPELKMPSDISYLDELNDEDMEQHTNDVKNKRHKMKVQEYINKNQHLIYGTH